MCVLFRHGLGLGKTFVGAEKMYLLNNDLNLVICQKSKITDWIEHFNTYYPEYEVFDLTNKKQCEAFKCAADQRQRIGIINYELAFRRDFLLKLKDFTLMLDESSLISNEKAKRSKFILKMQPESVILLSGTPTAGKYEKLWSQIRLLGWKISKTSFYRSYVISRWVEQGGFFREEILGYKNVEHLKQKLTEYGAIFMKTDEVINLPEQVEQKTMLPASKEYKRFMKDSFLVYEGAELVGDNSLTKILHARQLCGQWSKEKLLAFEDLINASDDRFIVFYNFNLELEKLEEIARKKTDHISILRGGCRDLEAYEKYEDSITFIQYQAGAMGGNFQKSNRIIYFTLPLGKGSCDLWEQSKKRIHRIGQSKTCFYYYLLIKGSFEEKNLRMLKEGKDLTDDLFEG